MHVPIPLRGPLSVPFRVVGIRPSRMNPNICTICELMFKRVMKARTVTIDATILFADLRAYTTLSQSSRRRDGQACSTCSTTVRQRDLGARWALEQDDRRRRDGDLQLPDQATSTMRVRPCWRRARCSATGSQAAAGDEFGVGIGIHCGQVSFGEFGRSHRDVTAIGTVVNTAARIQAAAAARARSW